MGAAVFYETSSGKNADEAFARAVDQARHEYGHRPYTGEICEKSEYVMITREVMTLKKAEDLANRLIEDGDPRIDSKSGPAGCIQLTTGEYFFFGWASC